MIYNKTNIKPFLRRMIVLHIKTRKNKFSLTGTIKARTDAHILFNINDEEEIALKYHQIIDIGKPEKVKTKKT